MVVHTTELFLVSVQPLLHSTNQLVSGLSRVNAEIKNFKEPLSAGKEDHFLGVMKVTKLFF